MRKLLLLLMMSFFSWQIIAQVYSNLYMVGAALECGWDRDKSYPMVEEEEGVFVWTGPMKRNDFKFLLRQSSWINCLNATTTNEKVVLGYVHDIVYVEDGEKEPDKDNKFIMSEEGVFKVTVDTKNMTMVIIKSDLISVSSMDGRGKRIINIHSSSGKTSDVESPYKLLIGEDENLKSKDNKWAYKGDNPWVIFSLSGIYSINKFSFRDGRMMEKGSDVYNIPEYKVYVSTTGTEEGDWTEIIHKTDVQDQDVKIERVTPVEARYIKFVPVKDPADEYIRIYGVDIYGTFVRPIEDKINNVTNIAIGKTIIDYHNCWSYRETPANILDGIWEGTPDEDIEELNNPWAFGDPSKDGWVIIDLEDEYDINAVYLVDSETWVTGYNVYLSSFVGKDEDWHQILSGTFDKEEVFKGTEFAYISRPPSGRYVKLEIPAEHQNGLTRIREFIVSGQLSPKPEIETNHAELKAAYELALWTVDLNTTQDGILNAGASYNGKWTRDLSINVWNGFTFLQPEIAKKSLLSLLMDNSAELIGAEYWDKIIWVKGAWMYYLVSGDKEFLQQIYKSGFNTMEELMGMTRDGINVFDAEYGLFTGPSVFNDGIAGYEAPVYSGDGPGGAVVSHPAHNYIKCLSTNCIYYEAYRILANVATILEDDIIALELERKAEALKENIRTYLFDESTGKLNYLIDQNGDAHPHQEGLGMSFAILFDIVTPEEAKKMVEETFVTSYGLPSISPHFKRFNDDKPGRHNMMIWPFVNAFWADACLKTKSYDNYSFELFNLIDLGLHKGGNNFWEIYDPKDGSPDGGWQTGSHWGGLQHQTWSATGFLNMVWSGLAGMQVEEEKIVFTPYLPEGINHLKLTNLKYGGELLNIELEGEGSKIKEFSIDGKIQDAPEFLMDHSGNVWESYSIKIVMEKDEPVSVGTDSKEEPFRVFSQNGSVIVKLNSGYEAESVQLFDITGKIISTKSAVKETEVVGDNLIEGVYLIKLKCDGVVYSGKVII